MCRLTKLRYALERVLRRNSVGDCPIQPLNARIKLFSFPKPAACATCLIGRSVRCSSSTARVCRTSFLSACRDAPSSLSCLCNVRVERCKRSASTVALCKVAGSQLSSCRTRCTSRRSRLYCKTVNGRARCSICRNAASSRARGSAR